MLMKRIMIFMIGMTKENRGESQKGRREHTGFIRPFTVCRA